MNIQDQVQAETLAYLGSEKLKQHIAAQAEKMINDTVADAFRYGAINDQVKKAIEEQIVLKTDELGLTGLSNIITATVREALSKQINEDVREKISKTISEMTQPLPRVVPVKILKKALLKAADTYGMFCGNDVTLDMLDGDTGVYERDVFTFIVEHKEVHNWLDLHIDARPNISPRDCEFILTIYKSDTTPVYRRKGRELNKRDAIYGFSFDLENFLMQMYMNDCTMDYEELLQDA